MAAPVGNQNRTKHGLRSLQAKRGEALRMTLSAVPKGCRHIQMAAYRLRDYLEAFLVGQHGEVDAYHGALIQTACKWEIHSQLSARWLRRSDATLTHSERVTYSREAARASQERDRCLKALGLDRQERVTLGNLYDIPLETPVQAQESPDSGSGCQNTKSATDAPESTPADAVGRQNQ